MVIGVGIDVVEIERFRTSLAAPRRCASGCSRRSSSTTSAPKADPVPSLAARFAAREAVMKALGLGLGAFGFHEVWVEVDTARAPRLAWSTVRPSWPLDARHHALAPVARPRRRVAIAMVVAE